MQFNLFTPPPQKEQPVARFDPDAPGNGWSLYEVFAPSGDGWTNTCIEVVAPNIRTLIANLPAPWTKIVNRKSGDFLTIEDYLRMEGYRQRFEEEEKTEMLNSMHRLVADGGKVPWSNRIQLAQIGQEQRAEELKEAKKAMRPRITLYFQNEEERWFIHQAALDLPGRVPMSVYSGGHDHLIIEAADFKPEQRYMDLMVQRLADIAFRFGEYRATHQQPATGNRKS